MVDFAGFSLELFGKLIGPRARCATCCWATSSATRRTTRASSTSTAASPSTTVACASSRPTAASSAATRPAEYQEWIAEHVEPWTYLKFPYLRKVGWKGFVDGADSGVYCVGPLGRLNAATGMATPRAQAEYERYLRHPGAHRQRASPTGPPARRDALGTTDRDALRGRAHAGAGRRSGDHLARRASVSRRPRRVRAWARSKHRAAR